MKEKDKECNCKHTEKAHNCSCKEDKNCECNSELHGELNDVSEDALGYLEIAQRITADFENYKRRNADIATTSFNNGVYAFIEKLLPVFDSFKQARLTIKDENALKGLEIIHTQLVNALKSFGVEKIECEGKIFDPNLHNAVMVENNSELEEDLITEELQEGFKSNSKVIRHSVVKINKK